jgi:hypothetical protein
MSEANVPPLRRTAPEAPPADLEQMRDTASAVIARRLHRWHSDGDLQFQYSLSDYLGGMSREEWAAWKRAGTLSDRLIRQWGRSFRT